MKDSRAVSNRLKYGRDWNKLEFSEKESIYRVLCRQVDTTHYKHDVHSILAEWINENYNLYFERERYNPDGDNELETVPGR